MTALRAGGIVVAASLCGGLLAGWLEAPWFVAGILGFLSYCVIWSAYGRR